MAPKFKDTKEAMFNKEYGSEPNWPTLNFDDTLEIGHALNWVNGKLDNDDRKKETVRYATSYMTVKSLKNLKTHKDYSFLSTGPLSFMINRGATPKDRHIENLKRDIQKLADNPLESDSLRSVAPKKNKDIENKATIYDIVTFITDSILERNVYHKNALYQLLEGKNRRLVSEALSEIREYQYELAECDHCEFFAESYAFLGKKRPTVKKMMDLVITDLEEWIDERTPKVKVKILSPEEQIKTFNYQKKCDTYKLKSIDPIKIIGAQHLLMFDTKTSSVIYMKSNSPDGFTVSGSMIFNVDESSCMKKMVMMMVDGKDTITKLKKTSQKTIQSVFEGIQGLSLSVKPKSSTTTIILSVK